MSTTFTIPPAAILRQMQADFGLMSAGLTKPPRVVSREGDGEPSAAEPHGNWALLRAEPRPTTEEDRLEGPEGPTPPQDEDLRGLEPHVQRVVRRALQKDPRTAIMYRKIHAVANQLAGDDWKQQPRDHEGLVRLVARDLCDSLLKRL